MQEVNMKQRHIMDILIVLSLFGAYAAGAMLLSAIGANVYKDAAVTMEENYDMRTGALYIAEKLRQNDVAGGLRMGEAAGGDALILIENRTGKGYETWIYVYEGSLCEVLTAGGADEPPLESGQAIMPMEAMELELSDRLVQVSLTGANGKVSNLNLSLRAARGELR
jgi:hypothetical protein